MPNPSLGTVLRQLHTLAVADGSRELDDAQLLEQFAARQDAAAFAALVRRHGRLVWSVCRNVLRHDQDAEDAFQATFLVLARRAASVRKATALPSWLHGVAYRVAMKAKRSAARRRNHERRAQRPTQVQPVSESAWRDLQAALDEEVHGLPERLRVPFVLCCLEGKGPLDAAGQLGWKIGTVRNRLSQARQELVRRLARRGVSLSAALCAAALSREAAGAALPTALAKATARVALADAAGNAAVGAAWDHIAALAEGVTETMCLTKGKIATVVVLITGLLAVGAGLAGQRPPAAVSQPAAAAKPPPGAALPAAAAAKADGPRENPSGEVQVSGRVLDPDGSPFAGAKVSFHRHRPGPGDTAAVVTDSEGRFRFRIRRTIDEREDGGSGVLRGVVVGVANGHGPGLVFTSSAEQLANVTVRLLKDMPVEGRVLSLEGQPIAGVRLHVRDVFTQANNIENLTPWVDALRGKKSDADQYRPSRNLDPALLGVATAVVTGADGTFRLLGIGRERLVILRFEGPSIETRDVWVITHPTETIGGYHGPRFDHAAAPTRPIVGTVRDGETGKPIAGVAILAPIPSDLGSQEIPGLPGQSLRHYLRATTDAKGRYRLIGLPRNQDHVLFTAPAADQPYLAPVKVASGDAALDSMTVDFTLKRSVVIRGRVTDKATGQPVGAQVEYFAAADNRHVNAADGVRSPIPVRTAKDGSFSLVGVPGRGLLAARALDGMEDQYLMAAGADRITITRQGYYFLTEPWWCPPNSFNTLVGVNPAVGAGSVVCDLTLDAGRTVTGTLIDPDGKPLTGVSISREPGGIGLAIQDLPTARFRLPAIDPSRPRTFVFRRLDKNLGAARAFAGDEAKPVTVRLQRCATLGGRLVDESGSPRGGVELIASATAGPVHVPFGVRTNRDGRFRIDGILPGMKVRVWAFKVANVVTEVVPELTLTPGETKDCGDVKAKEAE
jgi:RNA polymerase sigma factor (sigma-70 family)